MMVEDFLRELPVSYNIKFWNCDINKFLDFKITAQSISKNPEKSEGFDDFIRLFGGHFVHNTDLLGNTITLFISENGRTDVLRHLI